MTRESELKFDEMRRNYDAIKHKNERLFAELNELKMSKLDADRHLESHVNRCKQLEQRARDAEKQAYETTKRVSQRLYMKTKAKHLMAIFSQICVLFGIQLSKQLTRERLDLISNGGSAGLDIDHGDDEHKAENTHNHQQ